MMEVGAASSTPPKVASSPIAWMRAHLFSGVWNSLLTLATLYLLWLAIPPVVEWAFVKATWVGSLRKECTPGGACWVFVAQRWL